MQETFVYKRRDLIYLDMSWVADMSKRRRSFVPTKSSSENGVSLSTTISDFVGLENEKGHYIEATQCKCIRIRMVCPMFHPVVTVMYISRRRLWWSTNMDLYLILITVFNYTAYRMHVLYMTTLYRLSQGVTCLARHYNWLQDFARLAICIFNLGVRRC